MSDKPPACRVTRNATPYKANDKLAACRTPLVSLLSPHELKVVLQRELDLARQARRARDTPDSSRVYLRVRRVEARGVRHIEGFGPELQPAAFGDAELLEEREIASLEAVFAQNVRARIAVSELRRRRESRGIEPSLDRRIVQLARTQAVGPLAADADVGAVSRDGRRKRAPAAHYNDALNLPSSEQRVGETIRPVEQSLAAPHGQLVAPTGGQIVRNVEIRKRSFPGRIAADGRRVLALDALGESVREQIPEARRKALLQLRL